VGGSAVLSDTAFLTGGYVPGGTIPFTLTAPDGSTTTVGTVTVTGAGTYASPTVLATQVGTYTWHATYSGDGLNSGATDNGANESVTTVTASPTISTVASEQGNVVGSAVLSDTATPPVGTPVTGRTLTPTPPHPNNTTT